jgi:hypothetical protein
MLAIVSLAPRKNPNEIEIANEKINEKAIPLELSISLNIILVNKYPGIKRAKSIPIIALNAEKIILSPARN